MHPFVFSGGVPGGIQRFQHFSFFGGDPFFSILEVYIFPLRGFSLDDLAE